MLIFFPRHRFFYKLNFSLIVQKYQEANKALLRLQVENDDLKQRIDQMEK